MGCRREWYMALAALVVACSSDAGRTVSAGSGGTSAGGGTGPSYGGTPNAGSPGTGGTPESGGATPSSGGGGGEPDAAPGDARVTVDTGALRGLIDGRTRVFRNVPF